MDSIDVQPSLGAVLLLAERQHGLVTSAQLRGLGLHPKGIRHRVGRGGCIGSGGGCTRSAGRS
jgi:hypothetical protein